MGFTAFRVAGAFDGGFKVVYDVPADALRLFELHRFVKHEREAVDTHVAGSRLVVTFLELPPWPTRRGTVVSAGGQAPGARRS